MNEVSDYLRNLPKDERITLANIRKHIRSLIPGAEERLSRGVPFFYYKGKRAVGFRSSKTHLSFFIMEGNVLHNHKSALSGYNYSSTVIRFTPQHPIPDKLIRKLVLARVAEINTQIQVKVKT
ncbi:MAG: DUF1801 domain-containing protein [Cyclobacteriaceae bacterium]|nr:DUF1801 domain-containing protein [Cyclobacteriaceae bacterium]